MQKRVTPPRCEELLRLFPPSNLVGTPRHDQVHQEQGNNFGRLDKVCYEGHDWEKPSRREVQQPVRKWRARAPVRKASLFGRSGAVRSK